MEALNAKPDGYTIMLDNSAVSTQMELSVRDQNIKIPERTRIATVVTTPYIFCVSASSSYKTIKDLEADAKKDPGAFTWPSSGGNSGMDMGARQWFKAIGVDINKTRPVLAQSGGQAITLVTSGAAKMTSVSPTRIIPGVQAGTLRALLVTPKTRLPELPDTPTATEEGYPEVNQQDWTGFSGPANLPADIVDIWCKALEEAIKNPAVLTQIKNIYTYPFYHNSAEFNKIVAQESDGIYKLLGVKK
jgi:tripartite-type tricarboxylate transporter receptor subunit TctC